MSHVVLSHPELDGARVVVHVDAVHENVARGWDVVGVCSDRSREPLLSDDEQAAADQQAADLIAALRTSDDDTTPTDAASTPDVEPTDPAAPADDNAGAVTHA